MAPFKENLDAAAVERLAAELARAWPSFHGGAFVAEVAPGLRDLELLARVDHVAEGLRRFLPERFVMAAAIVDSALSSDTFDGWITLPVGRFVALAGLDDTAVALPLLARLTSRWSSEFAVRWFIEERPQVTWEHLTAWTASPDEHVRRLASEGTRPRLPWGRRLRALIADPSPSVELLDRLVFDESHYVRRSVANHLGDIAKDHPGLAMDVAERWLAEGDAEWVVRHGLRALVKTGDPRALRLVGIDPELEVEVVAFTVAPGHVRIGEDVVLSCSLDGAGLVVVDYVVHYIGARGEAKRGKVFKWRRTELPRALTKRHSFNDVSIRTHHPGEHRIELQVNGRVVADATVELSR